LGVTAEAIRGRIRRKTISFERAGGRVYVLLPDEQQTEQTTDHTEELIRTLQEQLEQANERDRENRRIIAALTSRIPAIEAPSEARESPETAAEASEGREPPPDRPGAQEGVQRPWWRRVFGS